MRVLIICLLALSACNVSKKAVYFTDMPDTAKVRNLTPAAFTEPLIQPDDIVRINIQAADPQAAASVNQAGMAPADQPSNSFLVDRDGNVHLPVIGTVKIGGLTTFHARALVKDKALEYFKSPAVQLQLAGLRVTVLGEVARPDIYNMPNERVTLLDAIGRAGDLTIFGKRTNVLLVRTSGEQKEFVRFNLHSSDVFRSPYFYLRQNDLIYVEPGRAKSAVNNAGRTQVIAIAGSIISVLIIALSRL